MRCHRDSQIAPVVTVVAGLCGDGRIGRAGKHIRRDVRSVGFLVDDPDKIGRADQIALYKTSLGL